MNMSNENIDEYLARIGVQRSAILEERFNTPGDLRIQDGKEFRWISREMDGAKKPKEYEERQREVDLCVSEVSKSESKDIESSESREAPTSPAYVPTPSTPVTPQRTSLRKLKRKALHDAELSLEQEKPVAPLSSPSVDEVEEITSFSASPISKKTPARRTPAKAKLKTKAAPLRQMPPLDLKTIVPSAKPDPPTSPIEEVSIIEPKSKGKMKAASSTLYLEIQRRIATHSSAKKRDKLIKISLPDKSMNEKSENETEDDDSSVICLSSTPSPRSSSPLRADASSKRLTKKTQLQPSSSKGVKGEEKEKEKPKATKSKKKEKPPPVTPEEYAQKLVDKVSTKMADVDPNAPIPASKFLHGMNIFYTGGDMIYASERTRGRMDLLVKHGANLLPRYDPSVTTHIITDGAATATMRALGIKDLNEIPKHIPTITWRWIVTGMSRLDSLRKNERVRMGELFVDAAFSSRIDAGPISKLAGKGSEKGKGKAKYDPLPSENVEFSHISEFTPERLRRASSTSSVHFGRNIHDSDDEDQDDETNSVQRALLSPPTSPDRLAHGKRSHATSTSSVTREGGRSRASNKDDPLAEFYPKARAEAETEWARQGEAVELEAPPSDSETDTEEPVVASGRQKKRGWTCDTKEVQRKTCVNQDIIDKLEELKALHAAKLGDEDRWRVFSYSKCIRALKNHPKRISSFAEARAIRGVGEKTATKIMEIIETGGLRRIGYEKTEDIKATKIFQGVYGVGQSTAYQWYAAGCRSLADVVAGKGGVKLTPAQEIDDGRTHEGLPPHFDVHSQRLDIFVGVLSKLLARLHAAGILTEDLALPEDPDDLEAIYRGLCRVPGRDDSKRRRIDFLTVPWASKGAALLYYTAVFEGDDIFNRAIRMKAGVLGYSLNQKGLFGGVVRDPRDRRVKLNAGACRLVRSSISDALTGNTISIGTLVASETEEEIFKILNVPWQEPHERARG
ncbi:hypothetical protein H0H87_009776 [Tephrocybe sp. NHM501043]|nr:hypothetical protein H0H87_009776 [Tephrocybe sp. NHM501043]